MVRVASSEHHLAGSVKAQRCIVSANDSADQRCTGGHCAEKSVDGKMMMNVSKKETHSRRQHAGPAATS
jgi:hypothetical protein